MTARERIGRNIARELHQQGRSAAWLARETQKAEDTINRYITGERVPSSIALYKIAKALGCPMGEFMEGVFDDEILSV